LGKIPLLQIADGTEYAAVNAQSRSVPSVKHSKNVEPSTKAERTRVAILSAAEKLFARTGYETTRLEDVAEIVGLTRAALFYYFRDKQTLYDAMLEDAFGSMAARLDEALSAPGTIGARIERAVEAWVDVMAGRPTLARLILRYIADADEHPTQRIYSSSEHFRSTYWELFEQGRTSGELKPLHADPFHAASAVVGHTVFYISALAPLIPNSDFESLAPQQIASHKEDVLHVVRYQLGITASRRGKKKN
jgi:AcrR family transcriptional regulator